MAACSRAQARAAWQLAARTLDDPRSLAQALGRARVFGERTPGMALPALMLRLPNQDVLYHAIADFVDPNGVRVEVSGGQAL